MFKEFRSVYFWIGIFAFLLFLSSAYLFASWKGNVFFQCVAIAIVLAAGLINAWSERKQKEFNVTSLTNTSLKEEILILFFACTAFWFISDTAKQGYLLVLFFGTFGFGRILLRLFEYSKRKI